MIKTKYSDPKIRAEFIEGFKKAEAERENRTQALFLECRDDKKSERNLLLFESALERAHFSKMDALVHRYFHIHKELLADEETAEIYEECRIRAAVRLCDEKDAQASDADIIAERFDTLYDCEAKNRKNERLRDSLAIVNDYVETLKAEKKAALSKN